MTIAMFHGPARGVAGLVIRTIRDSTAAKLSAASAVTGAGSAGWDATNAGAAIAAVCISLVGTAFLIRSTTKKSEIDAAAAKTKEAEKHATEVQAAYDRGYAARAVEIEQLVRAQNAEVEQINRALDKAERESEFWRGKFLERDGR